MKPSLIALMQWRSQPKILGGPNDYTLNEQQYFVRDTSSQSTKWQAMLKFGFHWLRLCSHVKVFFSTSQLLKLSCVVIGKFYRFPYGIFSSTQN